MTRTRVQKPAPQKQEEEVADVAAADSKQEMKDRMDDLLDEIDEVLEENAESFVAAYIQSGGQ